MSTTDNVTSASLLQDVTRYEDVQAKAKFKGKQDLGKQDFLTLFTAQLQNQNPLEPVKNEAFVAQLAQFSQLEALTNMQGSLDKFVTSMSAERMLGGASLIGKRVAVADSWSRLQEGGTVDASVDLPQGASGLKVQVSDSRGAVLREIILGAQDPGSVSLNWDGLDTAGQAAPAGLYRLTAQAVVNGKNSDVPVSTMTQVKSISTNPADGSVSLEVEGGKTVLLSNVQRVGQ